MPGVQELAVIAVVALLVFGPERLPELARNAGRVLQRFRTETQHSVDELKRAADIEDLDREFKGLSRDLRETRDSVMGPLRETTGTTRGRNVSPRPDDAPPPMDPEAT